MVFPTVWSRSITWRRQVMTIRTHSPHRLDDRQYRNHNSRLCSETRQQHRVCHLRVCTYTISASLVMSPLLCAFHLLGCDRNFYEFWVVHLSRERNQFCQIVIVKEVLICDLIWPFSLDWVVTLKTGINYCSLSQLLIGSCLDRVLSCIDSVRVWSAFILSNKKCFRQLVL